MEKDGYLTRSRATMTNADPLGATQRVVAGLPAQLAPLAVPVKDMSADLNNTSVAAPVTVKATSDGPPAQHTSRQTSWGGPP